MNGTFMSDIAKPFVGFAGKSEEFLTANYPSIIDNGGIRQIAIGRSRDSAVGGRGGYRITGAAAQAGGNYLETPDNLIPDSMLVDKTTTRKSIEVRVTDSMKDYIQNKIQDLLDKGVSITEAKTKVRDSIPLIGFYDTKEGHYVAAPVVAKVNDSILSGLTVPYWNISHLNKVFKQPFIEGQARNLVSTVGVPNVWADAISVYTETFEGMAKISNYGHANAEFNASSTVGNKMHQIVSELVNIVVEYETGVQEGFMAAQPGNPLSGMAIGDREKYARLMGEQLHNALILFGNPESGFDGLSQLTTETLWGGPTLNSVWLDATNVTKGATAVKTLLKMIGDMQEGLNFLPASVRINVSPTVYKVLKYTMQSDVYNPTNPLGVLANGFQDSSKIASNQFIQGLDFVLVPDPLCAANTPWNKNASDLMFITFPRVKSALEPLDDIIMSPVAIENYILPNYPQRDGLLRTMLKRVGSLIAPVEGSVKIVRGFGVQ